MSDRGAVRTDGERGRAILRLKAAVSEQRRLRDTHKAAKDAGNELAVDAALLGADEEVAARERWIKSVDDHDY